MQGQSATKRPTLQNSTVVFLVGDIESTMRWYERIGFASFYYPPGFCALCRDSIKIFLQQEDGYLRPDDPAARERGAWNVYIETDDVRGLYKELSHHADVKITRPLTEQEYGKVEFDVADPNGYVLVFAEDIGEPRS